MKKLLNTSFGYMIAGLAAGVFYREFTKFTGFVGKTTLGVLHPHLLMLGMGMFLVLALAARQAPALLENRSWKRFYLLYNLALPSTAVMLLVRGVTQVLAQTQSLVLSRGMDAAISGIAGLAHILMAVALFFLFSALKSVLAAESPLRKTDLPCPRQQKAVLLKKHGFSFSSVQSSSTKVPATTKVSPTAARGESFSPNTRRENTTVTRMLSLSIGTTTLAGPCCKAR